MSTAPWSSPVADVDISLDVAARLLTDQHPDLALLPFGAVISGWDNVTIRLGESLAMRLPRRAVAAAPAAREHLWLPQLALEWTFRAPVPVRVGEPDAEFPYPWAVVPWIEGERAYDAPLGSRGAADLGRALAQVHRRAPVDAPINPWRSVPLEGRAERFDDRVERLLDRGVPLADDLVREQFALGAAQGRPEPTWTHLDLHGANVLTTGGRLAGIIDWGDLGAGDPAADLGQAWCLVGTRHLRDLLKGYRRSGQALHERTMLRVRAEALAYAVTLAALDEEPYATAGIEALSSLGAVTG